VTQCKRNVVGWFGQSLTSNNPLRHRLNHNLNVGDQQVLTYRCNGLNMFHIIHFKSQKRKTMVNIDEDGEIDEEEKNLVEKVERFMAETLEGREALYEVVASRMENRKKGEVTVDRSGGGEVTVTVDGTQVSSLSSITKVPGKGSDGGSLGSNDVNTQIDSMRKAQENLALLKEAKENLKRLSEEAEKRKKEEEIQKKNAEAEQKEKAEHLAWVVLFLRILPSSPKELYRIMVYATEEFESRFFSVLHFKDAIITLLASDSHFKVFELLSWSLRFLGENRADHFQHSRQW
jgi:hypothetical protein